MKKCFCPQDKVRDISIVILVHAFSYSPHTTMEHTQQSRVKQVWAESLKGRSRQRLQGEDYEDKYEE